MAANASQQLWALGGAAVCADEAHPCSCDVVMSLEGDVGQAYNEEAFRYFLEIERKRAEHANRPLLLLLVDLKADRTSEDVVSSATAGLLFAGLSACLRETDFIGWYREGRVLGAVLTQRSETPRPNAVAEVTDRVTERLRRHVSQVIADRLQLRVYQLPSRADEGRFDISAEELIEV